MMTMSKEQGNNKLYKNQRTPFLLVIDMGRYVGTIKKLPAGNSFGEIVSHEVSGLTAFFDGAAAKGAKGPGGMIKGARVSFEIGGSGRAINIIRSHAEHPNYGRQKRFQSLAHK